MNKQPVYFLQTDSRWKSLPYSAPSGESQKRTIGSSGCGPTCAAMLITTITGKSFTPDMACEWSLKRGYKAPNQGTYYSYFVPQFEAYGIKCERLNFSTLYGDKKSATHKKAFDLLKKGYYLIACMGKGRWTSSGHFVVVWWEDGKIRINDPNSKADNRMNGDYDTFTSQVKYYWAVDGTKVNCPKVEKPKVEEPKETEVESVKYYETLDDIPAGFYRDTVKGLMEAGIIKGTGAGLHLSEDMIRTLVFCQRIIEGGK